MYCPNSSGSLLFIILLKEFCTNYTTALSPYFGLFRHSSILESYEFGLSLDETKASRDAVKADQKCANKWT